MAEVKADHDRRSGQSRRSAPLRAIALGAPIEGQRGTSTKRQGYWIRSCLCKNCIADRVAFGGCHDPPRGSRGERRAAVVLNAKHGTEAPRQCLSWSTPDFLLKGPHVRFRRVQTLVREGRPLAKLRNSARKGVPKRREDDHASDPLPRPDHTGPAILENLGAARACREGAVRGLDPGAAHGTPYIEATRALHAAMARHTTRLQ